MANEPQQCFKCGQRPGERFDLKRPLGSERRLASKHPSNSERRFALKQRFGNEKGQATLEYVLAGLILLAVLVGFATLQKRVGEGLFVEHALRSLSHAVGPNTGGVIGDVFLY